MLEQKWVEHYSAGSVTLGEVNDGQAMWFVVMDPGHFRVSFIPSEGDTFSVGLDAEWSDERPGELANFSYESGGDYCQPGEVTVSDDGVLSVLPLTRGASQRVQFRRGWTAQLPAEAVEPIRRAIEMVEAVVQPKVGVL